MNTRAAPPRPSFPAWPCYLCPSLKWVASPRREPVVALEDHYLAKHHQRSEVSHG